MLPIDMDLEVDKKVGKDDYYLQRDVVEYVERDGDFSRIHVEEVDVVDSEDTKIHSYIHREACVRRGMNTCHNSGGDQNITS